MPLWFVRGLRRGVVTTRYPARAESSAASLPTPPAFRPWELTRESAERMIAVCPSNALWRQDDALIFDAGTCTCCGRCAKVAPAAVTPSGEFELATTDRSALIKTIPILGDVR
jgi:formate hydrogenlyase subunit 6/NADH:ubiquinone oxidoreductase subunit I